MPFARSVRDVLPGLVAALLALLLLAVGAAPAGAARRRGLAGAASARPGLPPQGIYDSCPLATMLDTCESRLDVMHQGGLSVVLIGRDAPRSAMAAYAAHAQRIGMKIMWDVGDAGFWNGQGALQHFPSFAGDCGCGDDGSLLNGLVGFLASLPATFGYYVADDSAYTSNEQLPAIHDFASRIKSIDPRHMTLIAVAGWPSRAAEGVADAEGVELYPFGIGLSSPVWRVGHGAAAAAHLARAAGKPTVLILQAFNWGDNIWDGNAMGKCSLGDDPSACAERAPYPSPSDQLAMRNAAIAQGNPSLVLWYDFQSSYGWAEDPGQGFAPVSGDQASARWAGLSRAVRAPLGPSAVGARTAAVRGRHGRSPRHRSRRRGGHARRAV